MGRLAFHFVALCAAVATAYLPGGIPWHPAISLRKWSTSPFRLLESLEKERSEFQGFLERVYEAYPNANIATIVLKEHKPLGCTVEESLDTNNDPSVVFVSKIVEGGNAEKAGVKVGDVLIGVTGLFGEMTPTWQSGVEKIKGLVSSVTEDDILELSVARDTGVFERHEASVVDLCQTPGASDKDVDDCLVDFLSAGYDDPIPSDADDEVCTLDDADCLLDSMMDLWADEFYLQPTTEGITDGGESSSSSKPKPWSSRSSPSGTFVRDPVTGEMRNIDA